MKTLLLMAWRGIWRNRRRTLISMSAVGIGLLLIIFYSGLIGAMIGEAKQQLDTTGMGHVEISADGWRPRQTVAALIKDPAALRQKLKLPPGSEVGARVVARALATSAHGSSGVLAMGVDFADEKLLSAHFNDVRKGALPSQDDGRGILLGEGLAEKLGVEVGGKVRLLVQRADGEMGADLFRVRGIFHSVSPGISKRQIYVSMKAAQDLLGIGDAVHQVVVQLERATDADAVAAGVRTALGPGTDVVTYGQLLPLLKMMESYIDSVMLVAALFVYFLVGLGILNTMLMSVLERTREFGVLLALGTRPSRIVALVLAESFWIGTVSAATGLVLGLSLTWYGSSHVLLDYKQLGEGMDIFGTTIRTAFHTKFDPGQALKAAGFVYLMSLVVGLWPASRVARLHPSEALRRT